ncbi:MAG: tetratricopeptide repeat protein [Bacteroidetes bacterium]|nr:MAG: tetratricopeptide repeat protein [Bacteroidota bacterium]
MVLSCQRLPTSSYYERTFTPEEQKQLAVTLLEGIKNYYQGSSAEQMLLFEALAYDSTNAKVVREIGVPYLKRGFVSAFPKYYGRAADLDPLGWTGWRAYLYLYFYRDYDRAIRDFDATDIITPNQVDYPQSLSVDYLRGIAYLMKKDYHNALKYLNQHIAYESEITGREYVSAQAYLYKALALRALGELEHARTILIQAAIYHPYNADLLYWQAKVLQEQGDYTAARPLLQRARAAFAANDYNRHPYVEEFFQLYPDDFVTLESALNRHSTVE